MSVFPFYINWGFLIVSEDIEKEHWINMLNVFKVNGKNIMKS